MIKFYDTCSLLELQQAIFENEFVISSISINELEEIKNSYTKDEEIKAKARKLSQLLNAEENKDKFKIYLYNNEIEEDLNKYNLIKNNDSRIILSALNCQKELDMEILFVSDDIVCRLIAKTLGLQTSPSQASTKEEYTGVKELILSEEDLADFYISYADNENKFELLENQYIIIKTPDGKIVDKYKWKDGVYQPITFQKAESKMFGKIVPKNGDPYQQLALDSLNSNQITMLKGHAGTGKSYLAFGHMFSLLEHGKIDKIIIFCNTVATRGSAKLGFYPGSRTEKLLDSQIGNLLESKLGDRVEVERLIADGKLILLPMSDIRGYDTTGMNAAIYISEAQNLDVELMRLALQRIGEDSICIIDGDDDAQVDMALYAGSHNGMKRVSEVFKGAPFYGEVRLENIYRSEIAKLAQKL